MSLAPSPAGNRFAWLPLLLGLAIMLGVSIYPAALADRQGGADHPAALLLFWAMSAGIVRGVGFVPQHRVPRWLLSGWACWGALLPALWRISLLHGVAVPL